MSPNHSAEFYRGALSVLEGRPCTAQYYRNRLASAEAREAGEPTASDVINELREALEEIDNYRGGADTVIEDRYVTERRHDALAMAREYERKHTKEVIPGTNAALEALTVRKEPTAAEVIEAAEKALGTAGCYLCIYENEQRHLDNWEGSEDQGILRTDKDENAAALAIIARWKEANGDPA